MAPAVLDRPAGRVAPPPAAASPARVPGRASAEATLADAVAGTWRALAEHRSPRCLLCGAAMLPRYGAAGVAPVGGRCADCGTVLG